MKKIVQKYKQLLPSFILLSLCIWNFVVAFPVTNADGSISFIEVSSKNIMAGVASVVCILSFFIFRSKYKYVLLITLVAGTFEIINFKLNESTIRFGALQFGFHVTPVFVGLFTMIINYERFKKNPTTADGTPFTTASVNNGILPEDIEKFKLTYKSKSTEELKTIITNKKYVPAAQEAAIQLLAERQR